MPLSIPPLANNSTSPPPTKRRNIIKITNQMDSFHPIMVIKRPDLWNPLCIDRDMASSILACYWYILTPDLSIFVNLLVLTFKIGAIQSKIKTPNIPSMQSHSTVNSMIFLWGLDIWWLIFQFDFKFQTRNVLGLHFSITLKCHIAYQDGLYLII